LIEECGEAGFKKCPCIKTWKSINSWVRDCVDCRAWPGVIPLKPKFLNPAQFKVRVPGFDQFIGLRGLILIFLKNKNNVVLVKKKKSQQIATKVFIESCLVW
jgi:hypothetical protein